jgi:uncharacterized membrane protein YeaQ/YmgE (transglycosylase-associated protein family)
MNVFFFLIFGLVVGVIARAIMPGDQRMGLIFTMVLGVAGSFVGGILSNVLTQRPYHVFETAGAIGSILGAILLLALADRVFQSRARA